MSRSPKILTAVLVAAVASSVSFTDEPTEPVFKKSSVSSPDNAAPKPRGTPQGMNDEIGLVPLPRPITAPETGEFGSVIGIGVQLVGFTTQTFDGARGILNLTLACQDEFPASRLCNADDIRLTVNVPQAPGAGFAWVDIPPSEGARLTRVDETANCRGWRSLASTDSGMAMDLDVAYGSFVRRTCDQALRVACCATY